MKKIILIVVVLFTFFNASATHIMGGEITWVCIKDPTSPDIGKYIFKMKVYYDCDGTPGSLENKTLLLLCVSGMTNKLFQWRCLRN